MHECAWNVAVTNGITKQELRQYRDLKAEIEQLVAERAALRGKTGSAPDGQPRGTEPGDVTAETAILAEKISEKISARIAELTALRWRIELAVEGLTDSRDRRLIYLHYVDGLSWEQVAEAMDYDLRHIYRLHGWALTKLRGQQKP